VDDDAIRTLVTRLARPHPSGGTVIERATIVAEGPGFADIMRWIVDHGGKPQAAVEPSTSRGLHEARLRASGSAARPPARYLLPAGALD